MRVEPKQLLREPPRDTGTSAPDYYGLPSDRNRVGTVREQYGSDRNFNDPVLVHDIVTTNAPRHAAHAGREPNEAADSRIQVEVRAALARDGVIEAASVDVTCAGGVVTLVGEVADAAQRRAVVRSAGRCIGVVALHARLRLVDAPTP